MKVETFKVVEIPKNQFNNSGVFLETPNHILSIRVLSDGTLYIQSLQNDIEVTDNDGKYHTKKVTLK